MWNDYDASGTFDELLTSRGNPRTHARRLVGYLKSLTEEELRARHAASEAAIRSMGISFTVYSDGDNIDREWPFDIIPRVISGREWDRADAGLRQRVQALNCFIADVYGERKIVKDGVVPEEIILASPDYRPECVDLKPPYDVWSHVSGCDMVRDQRGTLYVLEDNLRVPSGVSYMLENRQITKRVLPELFEHYSIRPVAEYPAALHDTLASLSPRQERRPVIAVLTPGIYNSAYFEHAFLAQEMGAELVEGADLFVGNFDCVYMRTVRGPKRVDVIYRRVNDDFLDPDVFRENSMLGVKGLMRAWQRGKVAIANAPGSGVADDKVIYAFVPDMVRYYLDEDPILSNVPTYVCAREKDRRYVLANLAKLVVKPANESGGYGMMIGPHATKAEHKRFAKLIRSKPRNYIAQPTLSLSTAPTVCNSAVEPRHLDLRPFVLQGDSQFVTAGGLTRVAMKRGSLVVNSSQGGGSKDTWVID